MQERYAFFLDIDGTLLCDGTLVEKDMIAIRRARALGHKVCINTGRSMAYLPLILPMDEFDGFVSGIGCLAVADGKELYSAVIDMKELCELYDRMTNLGIPTRIEGNRTLICNELFADDRVGVRRNTGAGILSEFGDEPCGKMYFYGTIPEDVQAEFSEKYTFFQHPEYAEFSAKGCSKSKGMQYVLDYYGIDRAHCVAMGDSMNDWDMLTYAGISVAMGDALPQIREICSIVTCDAADGGVAEAMYKILGIQENDTGR